MPSGSKHLAGLDILRFLAALLVLLNHFATFAIGGVAVTAVASERAFPMLSYFEIVGAIGVQIFFVISGFVIAFSASQKQGRSGALSFLQARVLRIFPALWMSTLIGFVALWISGVPVPELMPRLVKSMTLFPMGPHIDGVIWTLMVEGVFYAAVGASIWLFGHASLVRMALTLGLLSSGFLSLLLVGNLGGWTEVDGFLRAFPWTLFLLRHGVFFAFGILLWARFFDGRKVRLRWLVTFAVFGCVEIWFAMNQQAKDFLFAMTIYAISFAGIYATIRSETGWLASGFTRWLGDISYPLYLNHYTLGMCLTVWLASEGRGEARHLLLCLVAIFATSQCVLWCERLIRRSVQPRGIFRTIVRLPLT